MNIVQIISAPPFAWATGGCARVVYELSKELVKRGHEVTMLTTDLYKPNQRYVSRENPEYIDGIQVFRFRYISNWLAWEHKIFISPRLIRYLRNHLREYDIVHLQDLISVHAIATAKYCKKHGVPYILTTHGSIPDLTEKSGLMQFYNKLGGSKILMNADKITVFTKTEFEQCKSLGVSEDKIKLVPNGIDLNKYNNLPEKGGFKRKYSIMESDKMILYVGRIEKSKGLDLLVKAYDSLSKELNEVVLVIVGPDDGYLPTLKKLIADLEIDDKVILTGLLDERDKLRAYVDADVHVSPRAWEPFGLTLLEACACGTPVICSKGCGISDFVDKKVGCVVGYDKDQLRDAIFKVLSDEGLRRRYGEEGRRVVKEQFCWDKIISKVEKIYSDLMKK